jgi:hypothetical protein
MIEGFEEITYELKPAELEAVPVFIRGFSKKLGKENAISAREICASLHDRYPWISEPRVRKIVNYIRNTGQLPGLLACGSGYYVSDDVKEMEAYCRSLSQRINAIEQVRKVVLRYAELLRTEQSNQ